MAGKVVATEVAEQEFARFLEAMDLAEKCDAKGLDVEDAKSLTDVKRTIISAMERGNLVVDDKGQPVYTPKAGDNRNPITFHEPTGADLMAIDQAKKSEDMKRAFQLLGAVTGETPARFAKMLNRDIVVCQAIFALFLG
jgi:CHASE1-domain containing sensor protein